MKKLPSKLDLRSEIEQQISDYLDQGGEVERVDRGISGRDSADGPLKPASTLFNEPRSERTLLPQVVAALEARRRPAKPGPSKSKPSVARKVPVYDDFGEVIRWVWTDETPQAPE